MQALPFPYAIELLTYWADYPPPHILLHQIAIALGMQRKDNHKLTEAEQMVANEPAISASHLPEHLKRFETARK